MLILHAPIHNTSDIESTDAEENDDNDDLFLSVPSHGTSSLNSGNNGNDNNDNDTIMCEIVSDGSNIILEKLAESVQAELSMQLSSYYIAYYSP